MYKGILLLLAVFVLAGCAQRAQGAAPSAAGGTADVAEVSTTASGTNDTGAADTGAPAQLRLPSHLPPAMPAHSWA